MKRIVSIFSIMLIIFFVSLEGVSADGLKILETSPKNGADGVPNENLGVKIFFSEEVYSKDNEKENKKLCKIVDSKGKEIKTTTYFNPKDKKIALVLVSETDKNGNIKTMKGSANYKLIVDGKFKSAKGNVLGESVTVKFKTLNPSTNTLMSMGMMVAMIVVMIFVSSRSMKKDKENEKKNSGKKEKFNPYKIAKETGKSVEEVVEAENRRKEKEALKAKKKQKDDYEEDFYEAEEEEEIKVYKVAGVRSAAEAGSKYVNNKRAYYKKKADIEAKIRASKKGKAKGKKKR